MDELKLSFRRHGLLYTQLKRNDVVALYGIGGTYTDEILHYEVDIIYHRKDKYGVREAIANNDTFGRDRSRCFNNEEDALAYFNKLTAELKDSQNLSQGVVKVIAGVRNNAEVVPKYHLELSC